MIFLSAASPLLMFILFSYGFSLDVSDIPFFYLDQNHSPQSRDLIDSMVSSHYFSLKAVRQFFRNIALVILVIFAVVLDPWAASEMTFDLKNYGFSYLDYDQTAKSHELLEKMRPPYFRLHSKLTSQNEINPLLLSGEAGLVIIIPEGFEANLNAGKSSNLPVVLDGTNSNSSIVALSYFAGIVEQFSEQIILREWSRYASAPSQLPVIKAKTKVLFNENLNDQWFLVLSEFLNAITMIAIILPAAATVYEKQTGAHRYSSAHS